MCTCTLMKGTPLTLSAKHVEVADHNESGVLDNELVKKVA